MSSSKNLESAAKHKSKVHQETVVEEEVKDEEVTMLFPQIITKEDVINNFFNQMVQLVITDMIVLEQENNNKDKKEETTSESNIIVKDYKDLKASDLNKSEIIAVQGSKVTLIKQISSTRDGWDKNKNSPANLKKDKTLSKTATIKEESLEKLSKTPSTETVSSLKDLFLMDDEREVKIFFTNGNIYEGQIAKCIMNGKGKYYWTDGTVYEGDFKDGFPTGKGVMTLPDLSHYEGDFNEGLFEGEGFLNIVSTPTFYSGQWKDGLRNGHGWLLHKPGQWYEGGWLNDYKHGFGVRFYKNRAKYRGNWRESKFDGEGIMIWPNNDFYKGEWKGGKMGGYGEYIWQAFYNKAFAFPIQNTYRGLWKDGKRHGGGVMNFGDDSGAKLKGNWCQDFKDGYGRLYCGNGKIIEEENLFQNDKPVLQTSFSMLTPNEDFLRHIREIPIFTMPESVDVSFYIKKILKNIEEVNEEKVKLVQKFEENSVKNIIIIFLPQLNELYHHYATLGTKEELNYKPVLIRLFLWKLFQDIEIHNLELSLVDADNILAENPQSCVESTDHPFEPIYFWQFLMSLIGIALTTTSLDDVLDSDSSQGVSAIIIKKFFEEKIFAKPLDRKGSNLFTYMDLVPINSVYSLYQQLGEPHTAKTFLRHTCRRKGEVPVLCYMEMHPKEYVAKVGTNFTALAEHIFFMNQNWNPKLEGSAQKWTSLYDFWRLGPRNVVRCLSKNCPLIVVEGRVVNMEYPLTFLEFYETLLDCIFLILDLEMKKEKILLQQMVIPPAEPVPQKTRASEKSADTDKKSQKTGKKGKKRKSKDKLP